MLLQLLSRTAVSSCLLNVHDDTRLTCVSLGGVHVCVCVFEQVASEQRRHKLSYHLTRATPVQDAAVLQVRLDSDPGFKHSKPLRLFRVWDEGGLG
jgi:hypothetical protein